MKLIAKPADETVIYFYKPYMALVSDDSRLLQHLQEILDETIALVSSLTEEQLRYRYAEGKWTIKDLMLHISDCERVIIYRAMRIARADKTDLPGFDENLLVKTADANNRNIKSIMAELSACRASSIAFIESLDEESLERKGTANKFEISVRLLVNHVYGHHRHHLDIIKRVYLTR
ncbi:MAG: DinB family protein [Ferruginibacter sp.]